MEAHWVTEARIVERRIQCTLSNALILPKLKAKLKLVKARTCTSAWLDLCWMYGPVWLAILYYFACGQKVFFSSLSHEMEFAVQSCFTGREILLTLAKKIFPPLLPGLEPVTFQSWVRHSNHWAIPTPMIMQYDFAFGCNIITQVACNAFFF